VALGQLARRRGIRPPTRCIGWLEAVGARQLPSRLEARVIGVRQQLAGLQDAVEVGEGDDTIGRRLAHKMLRPQLAWMLKARRRDELRQRLDGLAMEIGDAHRFVAHDNAALAQAVLAGHPGRAMHCWA
jgi:hypothetical protein